MAIFEMLHPRWCVAQAKDGKHATKIYCFRRRTTMAHPFIQALQKDHDEQRELTRKFNQSEPSEWGRLFQEIRKELKPHVEGEEASVFLRLKEDSNKEIRLATLEKLQEHHVMEILLEEARGMDSKSEDFWAKAKVLMEINAHHIEEEEEETFEAMEKQFSKDELDSLLEKFNSAKESAKKQFS